MPASQTARAKKQRYDQELNVEAEYTEARLGAEQLYRVRKYLVETYYEAYGGWADNTAEAAYALLGRHVRGFTIH